MADSRGKSQTAQERRNLRKNYTSVKSRINENKELLSSGHGTINLQEYLKEVNLLQQNAVKPREHALDAELFCNLTEAGCTAAKKLATNDTGRSLFEFIHALTYSYVSAENPTEAALDPSAFDWGGMGAVAQPFFRAAPGISCMLGPMDAEHKLRKVAQRQAKRPLGDVVRPEELADKGDVQGNDKQETDRNMEEMWDILLHTCKGECPVPELVCNHQSFAQTVENIFTLSFLVRDARVRLSRNEDIGMVAKAVAKVPKPDRNSDKRADKNADENSMQFVVAFTIADWNNMKKVVPTGTTKMRHRNQDHMENGHVDNEQKRRRRGQEAGPSNL